jgi:multicomponent Na+:H+ antiporter subunit E
MALWLLFSGHYDAIHIGYGVFSVLLILFLGRGLARVRLYPGDQHRGLRLTQVVPYCLWLLKEIVLAALGVAKIVLSPRMPVDPSILRFHADLPNAGSQVILANSITLTPGTITIDIEGGEFLVHALTDAASSSLTEGIMPERVARLYVGEEHGEVTEISITKSAEEL